MSETERDIIKVIKDMIVHIPETETKLLNDLDTLTDIPLNEWTIKINDEDYDPDLAQLKNVLELSPHQYRVDNEMELNEMREMAGITTVNVNAKPDSLLKDFLSKAGL